MRDHSFTPTLYLIRTNNHPIEETQILSNAGVEDLEVLAAILLDTVEDTETTPEELEKEFGERVNNLVMECIDNKDLSKT